MTALAFRAPRQRDSGAANWLIPLGLLALAFIPIAGGAFRLTTLVGQAEITSVNARFFASPIPVVLHIVSVTLFSILGAFQFVCRSALRWRRPSSLVLSLSGAETSPCTRLGCVALMPSAWVPARRRSRRSPWS